MRRTLADAWRSGSPAGCPYNGPPMTTRRDEKDRRRREREEREAAARRSQARRTRLVQAGLGAFLLAAVVVGIVLALGGGDEDGAPQASSQVTLPERRETDLAAAARAAGCEYREFPSEGRDHLPNSGDTFDDYKTNPPTSGTHDPVPAEDGIYEPGQSPPKEAWVHTLEHGRVILQHRPGLPARQRAQLEALFNEPNRGQPGYHMVLLENNTDMEYAVAAVAWTASVGCEQVNDRTWDALRAFRDRYTDQAPELIP